MSLRRHRCPVSLSSVAYEYNFDGETLQLGDEARRALEKGDIYKALSLLEGLKSRQSAAAAVTEDGPLDASTTTAACESDSSSRTLVDQEDLGARPPLTVNSSSERLSNGPDTIAPREAHARLIALLWGAGHEQEAVDTFDLARSRAKEAISRPELTSSAPSRPSPGKPGAGIPGLHLDLDREVCHGIMRWKLKAQDWLGVIEAMRAASSMPSRRSVVAGDVGARMVTRRTGGWAPTEETYALGLEACARVS